ncbi:MAG: PD-(D/E)XK nuclease family protein [Polyangia bacterium]|nr:PD-(D/E)XK nuclease family protein [Polyangia bacterium]
MTEFKNTHLSYSRLSRFEQCPLSFKLHYVSKHEAEPGLPLRFGKAIHAVLEALVREHMSDERTGPLSEDRAAELWQKAWAAEGLTGVEAFGEGLDILRRFVQDQGVLDHQDVLAVEKEFQLEVGPFSVVGFIDRVDRVDDETVVVLDYKSNRQIYARDEVDSSLQLSLYEVAVRQIWPWAKNVKLVFWMLRHGLRQETSRTPEQLEAALRYVETVGTQTEQATEFPPRLNTNCNYCDHRQGCPAYADALAGKREWICEDLEDLEGVAREREEVARLVKVLDARKSELERVIKAHLKETDALVLDGHRYAMFNTSRTEFPLERTLELLGQATGLSWQELIPRVATVDGKALDAVLKEAGKMLGRSKTALLRTELEAAATKSYSPRLWAKAVA